MRIRIPIICVMLLAALRVSAQSVLDAGHLAYVRQHLSAPAYSQAFKALMCEADSALNIEPVSVVSKEYTPSSGTKHDYVSLARYSWPDKTKKNGIPYITRDGVTNPEIKKFDREKLGMMAAAVYRLALAYYFSGDEKYAAKATQMLRVWFLDKTTRMNPNLRFAQHVPGVAEGRCYGLIDTYSFVGMLDGVMLLNGSKAFTSKDSKQLKAWFSKLLDWFLTHPQALEEKAQRNNHSIAYDAQVAAFALYTGRKDVFNGVMARFPKERVAVQIEPDGTMPAELRRTLAFHYSQYNLTHIIDLMLMARHQGYDISKHCVSGDRSFYKAMDYIARYMGKPADNWPYRQISGWDKSQQNMARDFYRGYLLDPTRTDWLALYHKIIRRGWQDIFVLEYETPSKVEDALAQADAQLRFALKCAGEARGKTKGKGVIPRTIDSKGNLVLVGPRDWCSGFFAGILWQMYQFTHTQFWRENAVSNTWLIESAKSYRGTHDLGFMFNNSFGKALHITGEQSYRDVLLQAARSLITRFSPKVGCIRSWDHNSANWKFPVIIDNMMNLEMLFEATRLTGDSTFHKIALRHADTTIKNHFREDCSSFHVVDYDPETGSVRMRVTAQGYSDDSYWSRGQGWGLYGFTMCYRYTGDKRYLEQARKIAKFIMSLDNMPDDRVFYWDMKCPDIPATERDASSAAIVASALYELQQYVGEAESSAYKDYADKIVNSLIDSYQAVPGSTQGFLLLHSVGSKPGNSEVDVPLNYADYYYIEALMRKMQIEEHPRQDL